MEVGLIDVLIGLSILAAIFGMSLWRYAARVERVFILFIVNNAFFEFLTTMIIRVGYKNNLPFVHTYTLIQFKLMTIFFAECFKVLKMKVNYMWVLVFGSLAIIANSIFIQSIYIYNSYSKSLVDLYIMVCSVSLFIYLIKDRKHDRAELKPSVSFAAATYLASSISFVIFLFGNVIMNYADESKVIDLVWDLRMGVNFITIFITFFGLKQLYDKNLASCKNEQFYG